MNLVNFIFEAASKLNRWSQPAIFHGANQYTYEQLLSRVRRSAALIRQCGINPGDRIAIVCCDCPDFVCCFLGSIAAGSIAVPVSTMLPTGDLEFILGHCGARAVLLSPDQEEKVWSLLGNLTDLKTVFISGSESPSAHPAHSNLKSIPQTVIDFSLAVSDSHPGEIENVGDDQPAFILYTSGSTGKPKGAIHLHRNLPYTVNAYCRHILQVQPDDRLFSSSRLFFAYGLGNSLSFPLGSGAAAILCSERPTPAVISEIFARRRPTLFFGVPALFRSLIEYSGSGGKLDTSSIRFCVSAGEKMPERIYHEWKALTGLELLDGIGSTEMLHMFMSNRLDHVFPGSSGTTIPGYEARLVDPAGADITGEGTGNLLIKGGSACAGYWNNPEKTASTIIGEWVRTGDLYRRDALGNFWFEGRSDDLFKVNGLWVSPVEVEEALLEAPEVVEAAVVPAADADGIVRAVAYVVLKSNATLTDHDADQLKALARSKLPSHKCPSDIYFTDQLPRTATGKLQRFKLRS